MERNNFVVVDDGYARIKAAWWDGAAMRTLSIPAMAKRGRALSTSDGGVVGGYVVGEDGTGAPVEFTVSDRLTGDLEPTRISDYASSDLNRALVHHAMVLAGFGGREATLATGLPMGNFFAEGVKDRKLASLAQPVRSLGANPTAVIAQHHVYPQALMAWVDHVIDEAGAPISDNGVLRRDLTVCVVDVGGRTTDFAIVQVVDNTPVVDRENSTHVELGMLTVLDTLRSLLAAEYKVSDLSDAIIERALSTGVLRIFGVEHAVQPLVEQAATDVARRLVSEVQRRIGSGVNLDRLVFVGGGSTPLRGALEAQYRHVFVADAPELANARGMLKYMTFIDPRTSPGAAAAAQATGASVTKLDPRRTGQAG